MAFTGLRTNLLRSILATLGVIIGVASVVAAMSILEGAQRDIIDKFQSFGSNQLTIIPGDRRSRGRSVGQTNTLRVEDADAIMADCPTISAASPESANVAQVKFFSKNKNVQILGTSDRYAKMNKYKPREGRFLSNDDVRAERRVVCVGHKVAKDLFGNSTPVGQTLRIGIIGGRSSSFRIIGVMEKKGNLGLRNVDNQVIVPVTTAMKRLFGVTHVSMISVQVDDPLLVDRGEKEIKKVLRKRHKIAVGRNDDFTVVKWEEQLKQVGEAVTLFAIVFYSIAGISLVVGGIGIMNIMLVSVTERTREIGVRMAVGAQRRDILSQFLIEGSAISFIGGGFGVLLGLAMAGLIENMSQGILETYTPPKVIVWALTMAVLTGIFSGLYPAYKASRLDPVEALRYE